MSTTRLPAEKLKSPVFFDLDQLGERWHCHRVTAYRRLQRFGVKPFKPSERALLFRASDIARIEFEGIA
jgi:hypothetical protein